MGTGGIHTCTHTHIHTRTREKRVGTQNISATLAERIRLLKNTLTHSPNTPHTLIYTYQGPVFTAEEIAAFKEVKAALIAAGTAVTEICDEALVTVTMLCKLEIEKSVEKYTGMYAVLR